VTAEYQHISEAM